jgi:hypothetical protein
MAKRAKMKAAVVGNQPDRDKTPVKKGRTAKGRAAKGRVSRLEGKSL